jgi:protein gp37
MGTSVENQLVADTRIPALLQIPAALRFLSCEPLLSEVMVYKYLCDQCDQCERSMPRHIGGCFDQSTGDDDCDGRRVVRPKVDWVIAGGESGPHARQCHHWWAEFLQRQCKAAGIPFFFKQWGEWIPYIETCHKDLIAEIDLYHAPDGTRVVGVGEGYGTECWRLGKDKTGRRLFGREYNEIPTLEKTK